MRNFSLAFAAALLLGTAAAPVLAQSGHAGHSAAATAGKPRYGDFGLDLTAMDRSVKPGDSFWHFVNGNWDKT
ncbi:MAG TPA: M13 family peptidase, partial [Allosphingosinicella sp.]|nr:M13 family peptidase [Allosphingosinicella sp.]